MIRLLRSDGMEILLNVALIRSMEWKAGTIVTLVNDERIAVKNSIDDILIKMQAYRHGLHEERKLYDEKMRQEQDPTKS